MVPMTTMNCVRILSIHIRVNRCNLNNNEVNINVYDSEEFVDNFALKVGIWTYSMVSLLPTTNNYMLYCYSLLHMAYRLRYNRSALFVFSSKCNRICFEIRIIDRDRRKINEQCYENDVSCKIIFVYCENSRNQNNVGFHFRRNKSSAIDEFCTKLVKSLKLFGRHDCSSSRWPSFNL